MSTERKHARCSPSKLKNLEICPSYTSDNSEPPHPVTLRGTAMHEALETGVDTDLVDDAERSLVSTVREFIEAEKTAYGVIEIIDELKLETHHPDVSGYADRIMVGPLKPGNTRTIYVRDYKMGFNLVDIPSVNPQAISYAIGAFDRWLDADEVHFSFMLPRLDTILEHTFKRTDLPSMRLRISTIAERVREHAGKIFNVQDENCLYCGRKATCEVLHKKALVIANGYNDDTALVLPKEFHSSLITDPVEMSKALNVADVLEKWAGSVKAHALAMRLELGIEIPGRSLVERSGKRSLVNVPATWDIAQTFNVTHEEFLSAADVSIPALEKAVSSHVEKGKAVRVQEFNDALLDAGCMTRGNSYHVLQKERKKKTPEIAA